MYHDASEFTVAGNVGNDPELRFTKNGKAVVNLRLARWMGDDNEPQWLDIVLWENLAEHGAVSISKGDRILVTGRFELRYWTGEDGNTRTTPTVVADDVALSLRWNPARSQRKQRKAPEQEPVQLEVEAEGMPF